MGDHPSIPLAHILMDLFQLRLDNALSVTRWRPELGHLETSLLQQPGPLRLRALHAVTEDHHLPVPHRGQRCAVAVHQDKLLDNQLRVALGHRTSQLGQDNLALLVGPVVEDKFHIIDAGAYK